MYLVTKLDEEIIGMASTKKEALESASRILQRSEIGIRKDIILGRLLLFREADDWQEEYLD